MTFLCQERKYWKFEEIYMLGNEYERICENSSVPRHFLTIGRGLYYLTPLRPTLVHATSLRQAEQSTYLGSVTRMITHFVSRA